MSKLLIICIIVSMIGCSSVGTGIDDSIDKYRIIDWNKIEHLYKENLKEFNYPVGNNKLIQYCGIHYEWEVIHVKWGMHDDEFGWSYRVIGK